MSVTSYRAAPPRNPKIKMCSGRIRLLPSTILTVLVVQSVGTRRLLNHDVMAYKRDYGGVLVGLPTPPIYSPTLPTPVTFVLDVILHHAVTLQLTVLLLGHGTHKLLKEQNHLNRTLSSVKPSKAPYRTL